MFLDFIKNNLINNKKILLYYYKNLEITDSELLILTLIINRQEDGLKIATPSDISKFLNLEIEEIEDHILSLQEKGLLIYNISSKKQNFDLYPLFNKLAVLIETKFIDYLSTNDCKTFISKYFKTSLTNDEKAAINFYEKKEGSLQLIREILLTNNFKNLGDFLNYLENVEIDKDKKITKYD